MPQIDWSNPTVQGAWVAAAVALVAAVAGFAGAILGASIGARAARHAAEVSRREAQADRDAAAVARREEADRASSERWLSERRALIASYLVAVDQVIDSEDILTRWKDKSLDLEATMLSIGRYQVEIGLVAPELADAMSAVWRQLDDLIMPFDSPAEAERQQTSASVARDRFAKLAVENLAR